MEIYIVERWINVQGDEGEFAGVFCFDSRDEAETFATKMGEEFPHHMYFMMPDDLFTSASVAMTAAKGE